MLKLRGYYYVEASTLFRRQSDGVDMPAEITLPNVKIQSNFTFSMASQEILQHSHSQWMLSLDILCLIRTKQSIMCNANR